MARLNPKFEPWCVKDCRKILSQTHAGPTLALRHSLETCEARVLNFAFHKARRCQPNSHIMFYLPSKFGLDLIRFDHCLRLRLRLEQVIAQVIAQAAEVV